MIQYSKGVNIDTIIPTPEQPQSWLRHHRQAVIFGAILIAIIGIFVGILIAHDIAENRRLDATSVTFKDAEYLTIPFGMEAKVSDFIEHLSGSMVDDFAIPTDTLGSQDITFEYINIKNRRRKKTFTITVADVTPPRVFGQNAYTVARGYEGDLTNLMLSGDDLDDHPIREIVGKYDLNQVGKYSLEYRITDASGNSTSHPFTLNVIEPTPNTGNTSAPTTNTGTPIKEIIQQHKTASTKIGIDVSSWQGDIDWSKVKATGVEFAFIRVGYGYNNENFLDAKFQANIEGATAAGLPVGVYFYSYADNTAEAEAQAEWVHAQIQNYPVELGVVFDWEDWSNFNQYDMSFRTLNQVAQTFLDTAACYGHQTTLYGSKYYLEQFWQPITPVWLAQYYDTATYGGEYWIWQLTDSGNVNGISGNVDVNVMYLDSAMVE